MPRRQPALSQGGHARHDGAQAASGVRQHIQPQPVELQCRQHRLRSQQHRHDGRRGRRTVLRAGHNRLARYGAAQGMASQFAQCSPQHSGEVLALHRVGLLSEGCVRSTITVLRFVQ